MWREIVERMSKILTFLPSSKVVVGRRSLLCIPLCSFAMNGVALVKDLPFCGIETSCLHKP